MRPTAAFPIAWAAPALILLALPAAAAAMVVPLNHSARLAIRGSAASVLVANPSVADVSVVDSHTLFVQGLSNGITNVVVLDRAGRTLFNDEVSVEAPGQHVSVFHGAQVAEMGCSPRCTPSASPDEKSSTLTKSGAGGQTVFTLDVSSTSNGGGSQNASSAH